MINLSMSKLPISINDKQNAINLTGKYSMLYNLKEFNGNVGDVANIINKGHIVIPATFKENKKNDKGQYTRCYANFNSLNTLFIDIDNQEEVSNLDDNGNKVKEVIKYKVGDKKHISISRAKEVLNNLGLEYFIIYTTMSHSEEQHKFRIGFLLKEPITDITIAKQVYLNLGATVRELNVIPDARALEPSRLFFPGKVIEVKDNSYLDITKLHKFEKCNKDKSKENENKDNDIKTVKVNVTQKSKDYNFTLENLLDYINTKVPNLLDVDFSNRYDVLNGFIDLTELFQVVENEKFSCIFHSDSNPSAYIYKNGEITIYHCFSCDERLNAVQLIKKLFDLDEYTFIKILEENTNIRIGSAYQKKAREIAMSTMLYLADTKGFERDNEIVFKYLRRRNLFLMLESLYILGSLNTTINSLSRFEDGITFFSAISFIRSFYNGKFGSNLTDENIRIKINTLANLGLIRKLDIEELKDNVKDNCKTWMKNNGYVKYPNFYYITPITPNILKRAEDIILLEKKAGVKVKNSCKKQSLVIQSEVADEIYVQNKAQYNISEEPLYLEVVRYLNNINKQWFEIKEIIKNIDKYRKYNKSHKEKQVEIYLTKLALEEKIKKVKCSKANKTKYGIPDSYTHYESVYVLL